MNLTTERYVDLIKLMVMERNITIEEADAIVVKATQGDNESVAYVEESILVATR